MTSSRIGSLAALLGGLVWVAAAVLDWGAEPDRNLYLAGLGLLVLALAGLGYSLVASAPAWLRLVVTVATTALGYSVWVIVRQSSDPDEYLALVVAGIVLVAGGGIGLGRSRGHAEPESPGRGSHAAR